jgi:DNA polymerase epsilon subunit 1
MKLQGQSERAHAGRRENVDRERLRREGDEIDYKFGFESLKDGPDRLGWLLNWNVTSMPDETGTEKSALDLYFVDKHGGNFKATVFHEPYFYVDVSDPRRLLELVQALPKRLEGCGCKVSQVELADLDMPNHLSGKLHKFLKLSFGTVAELMDAKTMLRPVVAENEARKNNEDAFDDDNDGDDDDENATNAQGRGGSSSNSGSGGGSGGALKAAADPMTFVSGMREYDVPYDMRVSIDKDLRVGSWHNVSPVAGTEGCEVTRMVDMLELCEPKVGGRAPQPTCLLPTRRHRSLCARTTPRPHRLLPCVRCPPAPTPLP